MLLLFYLIFCQFQSGASYKSFANKKIPRIDSTDSGWLQQNSMHAMQLANAMSWVDAMQCSPAVEDVFSHWKYENWYFAKYCYSAEVK